MSQRDLYAIHPLKCSKVSQRLPEVESSISRPIGLLCTTPRDLPLDRLLRERHVRPDRLELRLRDLRLLLEVALLFFQCFFLRGVEAPRRPVWTSTRESAYLRVDGV